LTANMSGNDMVMTVKAVEAAFATILNGTAINTANAITDIGNTKVAAVNTAGTTQVNNVNNAGTTKVNAVNSAGTTALGNIESARVGALDDIEDTRLLATASVLNAAGGTNPFLLMGA